MDVNGGGPIGTFFTIAATYVLGKVVDGAIEGTKKGLKGYYVTTDSQGRHWYSHGGGNLYIDNDRGEREGH